GHSSHIARRSDLEEIVNVPGANLVDPSPGRVQANDPPIQSDVYNGNPLGPFLPRPADALSCLCCALSISFLLLGDLGFHGGDLVDQICAVSHTASPFRFERRASPP